VGGCDDIGGWDKWPNAVSDKSAKTEIENAIARMMNCWEPRETPAASA